MRLFIALCAAAFASLASSSATASCEEIWGAELKERPEITCTPLTDETLVSLEGATRARVISVMKAAGRPISGEDVLHYVGASDHRSGDVNFAFEKDIVVRIFGFLDSGEKFVWNPSFDGPGRAIRYYR